MLNAKQIICSFLAVVMTTSSAFSATSLTASSQGYMPTLQKIGENSYKYTEAKAEIKFDVTDPQVVKQRIQEMMSAVEGTQQTKGKQSKLLGAATHTLKAYPMESLYFFLGMGAVAFGQLVLNNSHNPVGLQQHIEHSLSPMGMAGFAVFMYFNNLTSTQLMTMTNNPAFMKYVPYLGMTAGFLAQSIFSHVAGDPNIKACVLKKPVTEKDKEAGVDEKPCVKAMENFADLRLAPSLTSMLLSTLLAAKAEKLVKAGFSMGKSGLLKLRGVDVALTLAPGKVQVSAVRAVLVHGLGKVAQITAFVQIDEWLNRIVTYAWKNFFDGSDFYDINNSIVERLNYLKTTNWVEPKAEPFLPNLLPKEFSEWIAKDRTLEDRLKYFQKRMTDWRMTNLADVYEAHQNWNMHLQQLTGKYASSHEFYTQIINAIRTSRFDLGYVKPLEIPYPLTGLKAYNVRPEAYDAMVTHPKMFEGYQRDNLKFIARLMQPGAILNPNYITENFEDADEASAYIQFGALLNDLEVKDKKKMAKFHQMITSTDDKVVARALYNLRQEMAPAMRNPEDAYSRVILALINILGAPSPQMEPGRGYVMGFQFAPSTQKFVSGLEFRKGSSMFGANMLVDHYLMQMVCGPDITNGDALVEETTGFPSNFRAPMIRPAKHKFDNECNSTKAYMTSDSIYTYKISQDGKTYRGFLNYIRETARASIVGHKENSNFQNWWDFYTTKQMKSAFDAFGVRYDEIVVKLVRSLYYQREEGFFNSVYNKLGLNQNGRNSLNQGPVGNGALQAMFQEERMYLAILEEIMFPKRSFDFSLETALERKLQVPEVREIEKNMIGLSDLLKKIQIKEIGGRERIESSLMNDELESQVETIQKSLHTVKLQLGLVGGEGDIPVMVRALNDNQKAVAKVALDSLSKLADEMANYGRIANAVSWNKIYDDETKSVSQTKSNPETEKALRNSGRMTAPAGQ
ncbi:hypothetical protein [Bdellovibrio sp. HCB2-146]|uniref:hypothetical protein n=1 Tax=Bdellovibrio sp. HCB2-146 TaxID=3394362 RepID=UPI0039BD2108